MRVKITNQWRDSEPTCYYAESPEDCKDDIDRAVYMLVNTHNDIITMGITTGEQAPKPVKIPAYRPTMRPEWLR